MNDPNPYKSPAAAVAPGISDELLAGRGTRLGAALIDGVIMSIIVLPAMYAGGYFAATMVAAQTGQRVGFGLQMIWALIGFVLFVLVQAYPLNASGQTWGKKILGIRITDLAGNKPPLGTLLGKRYLPVQAASAIPFIGILAVLVDTLLIFREDRRCAHDLIAGTQVLRVR